jgi:hypothetical protein
MGEEANGKGSLVEHILSLLESSDLPMIAAFYRSAKDVPVKGHRAGSFLFHLARLLIDASGMSKRERSEETFALMFPRSYKEARIVEGLYLVGNLDKLELSNTTFLECVFSDSIFSDCAADSRTCFKKCFFTGSFEVVGSDRKSWRDVSLMDCKLDFPTNLAWEELLPKGYGSKEQNIRDALKLALSKFWKNGQPHWSINKNHWAKGPLGQSIHCKPILEALLRCKVIAEITISGIQEGGYAFSKECLGDLQRFMDNGQLTGRIREVFSLLFN